MISKPVDMLRQCATLSTAVAKDAAVYLDHGAAEAGLASFGTKLQQAGKPAMLAKLGLAAPEDADVSSFWSSKPVSKVLIIITRLLTTAFEEILQALQAHKHVKECHILCSFSEEAHVLEAGFEGDAFQQFATSVQQALQQQQQQKRKQQQLQQHQQPTEQRTGNSQESDSQTTDQQVSVAVHYFPLHVCPLTDTAFVLPACAPATAARFGDRLAGYSHFETAIHGTQANQATDDEEASHRADLRLLAHTIVGFAAQQNLRLDTFAMGSASRALGDEICPLSPPVGSNGAVPSTPASIILIDRQLDIVSPARHHPHVLDCIFGQLESRSCSSDTNFSNVNCSSNASQHLPSDTDYSKLKHGDATSQHLPNKAVQDSGQHQTSGKAKQLGTGAAADLAIQDAADETAENSKGAMEAEGAQSQEPAPLGRPHKQMINLSSADVKVPLNVTGPFHGMHGSLLGSGQAREWLQFLMGRQPKDALLYLRKWLKEAARKEGVQLKGPRSKLTDKAAIAEEIKGWTEALMAKPSVMLKQLSIVQLACAAVHALTGKAAAQWAALDRQEQNLMQLALQGTESLVNAVVHMLMGLNTTDAGEVTLQDAVLLLSMAFCLAAGSRVGANQDGPSGDMGTAWHSDQELAIKDALVDAIVQADFTQQPSPAWLSDLPHHIQQHQQKKKQQLHGTEQSGSQPRQQLHHRAPTEGWEEEVEQEEEEGEDENLHDDGSALYHEEQQLKGRVEGHVERLLGQLREAAALQARTQDRLQRSSAADGLHAVLHAEQIGLVQDIARRVLKRQPIPGLYHATASLRGLLRGGFGRLGLQKQPHPADNPVVLLFVVGGVSMLELREACQEIDSQQSPDGKQIQLLIGSTALLRPDDLYQNMIGR